MNYVIFAKHNLWRHGAFNIKHEFMLTVKPPFSNMQMELLKLYAAGVPDELLPEIKELLARFLLNRAKQEAGKIWLQKGYDLKTIEKWKSGESNPAS